MKDSGYEEGLVIGHRGLDREHRTQLQLLTAFGRSIEGRQRHSTIDEILDPLIDHTKMHFSSEQLLMRLYEYPRYQEHVDGHERTIEYLENLRRVYLIGSTAVARVAADQLSDWIFAHIRGDDRALAHFLVRLGAGPG
jgi:hemerythrin